MKNRNEPVRLLGRRFLLVGLLGLAIIGIIGVINTYQKERESAALEKEAVAQATDLTQREAQLQNDVSELQTDRGREGALREQYALAAEGEQVIVIVDRPSQVVPTASSSAFVIWLHKTFPWW